MLFNQIKSSGNFPQPKNVSLVWQVANGLPSLMTDAEKLQVILENLISNALKFTDRGQVEVSAKSANMHEQCMVEFKVSDTGIVLPTKACPLSLIYSDKSIALPLDPTRTLDLGST